MSTKRADQVVKGEWVRAGQQAFRVGQITRRTGYPNVDRLEFQVGRGGAGFYTFDIDAEVEVVALVEPEQAAALAKVTETLARFREHAVEQFPAILEFHSVLGDSDDPDILEALTWLAAADELRIALGLRHPDEDNPDVDTESSASRQTYIETGRYLRVGEDES